MELRSDPAMRKVSFVADLRQMKALAWSLAQRLRLPLHIRRGQWLRLAFLTGVLFFFLLLLLAPGSSSSVYATEQAPAAAQEAGLPAPPTDATGQALPPVGVTVPQADLSANVGQEGLNSLALPLSLECNGTNTYTTAQDGDPYPLCPGPMPTQGGNCTWWAWQMWHRLGYNLPHWGDAALWIAGAQHYGLQVGTEPRVNAIAVFPVGDGVWAWNSSGHVAFVTKVYSDLDTFDVSYQNYGDSAVVHYGLHYRVSLIQQPRFQNGHMRFIYFPGTGGVPPGTGGGDGGGSSQQVINNYVGKFSSDGHTQVLRYNRTAGTFDLLELSDDLSTLSVVPLEDSTTQQGHWGSAWEVYIGDFSGRGSDDLLLYDRKQGVARFLTFYSDLTINTDVVQKGWKSSWEIYVGDFDGSHDQLLFYDRNTSQDHGQYTPAPGEPTVPTGTTGQGQSPGGTGNGSSSQPDWEHSHRTATLALLDYNSDFTVRRQVNFDRWQNTWEVHIGHYGQVGRDGILFYDRAQGELRVVVFDNNLSMKATYQQHKVPGGLEIYSGDFDGSLQDSLFLFNRSAGTAQLVAFQPDLTVRRQVNYTNWGKTWEFYLGHFGGPSSAAVSFLLYSRNTGVLSFIGFGSDLTVARQARYQGIRSNWEVFVGQFSACSTASNDATATNTTPTATPTNTATPDPNNDDAPPAPGSGSTVTVTQACGDSVLLVDENTGKGQLIIFSFDNGLQGGKSLFTETPVPWITPTPTNTATATRTPKPTRTPTSTPTSAPTSPGAPAPSPTNSPTPTPTNSPTPTPTNTTTPTPTP